MRKITILICQLYFIGIPVLAQTTSDDFNKLHEKVMGDYNGFRKSVLDGYADYLNTVWREFQVLKDVKREGARG